MPALQFHIQDIEEMSRANAAVGRLWRKPIQEEAQVPDWANEMLLEMKKLEKEVSVLRKREADEKLKKDKKKEKEAKEKQLAEEEAAAALAEADRLERERLEKVEQRLNQGMVGAQAWRERRSEPVLAWSNSVDILAFLSSYRLMYEFARFAIIYGPIAIKCYRRVAHRPYHTGRVEDFFWRDMWLH